jgi:hypothetical protein
MTRCIDSHHRCPFRSRRSRATLTHRRDHSLWPECAPEPYLSVGPIVPFRRRLPPSRRPSSVEAHTARSRSLPSTPRSRGTRRGEPLRPGFHDVRNGNWLSRATIPWRAECRSAEALQDCERHDHRRPDSQRSKVSLCDEGIPGEVWKLAWHHGDGDTGHVADQDRARQQVGNEAEAHRPGHYGDGGHRYGQCSGALRSFVGGHTSPDGGHGRATSSADALSGPTESWELVPNGAYSTSEASAAHKPVTGARSASRAYAMH